VQAFARRRVYIFMGLKNRRLPFVCECGNVGCEKCVPLTADEYAALPAQQPGLALAPGHELLPADDTTDDRERDCGHAHGRRGNRRH
jgi:hypothetical protein